VLVSKDCSVTPSLLEIGETKKFASKVGQSVSDLHFESHQI